MLKHQPEVWNMKFLTLQLCKKLLPSPGKRHWNKPRTWEYAEESDRCGMMMRGAMDLKGLKTGEK